MHFSVQVMWYPPPPSAAPHPGLWKLDGYYELPESLNLIVSHCSSWEDRDSFSKVSLLYDCDRKQLEGSEVGLMVTIRAKA